MRESLRMQVVQSPIIPVVADWIRQTPGTISLGQGVPYFGPPPQSTLQVERFAEDPDNHKYRPVIGIPPLLRALEDKLRAENHVSLTPHHRLLVTAGGNQAFVNALLAIADPGDEVIFLRPFYFNHEMAVVMAGCRPVVVPTDAHYQPRLDLIQAAFTPRTRAVVTISPNNPTGAVYPEQTLRAINRLCEERQVYHVHDHAYEYFVYDGQPPFSPSAIRGSAAHTISLFSFSKSFGMSSWRLGYMLIPAHLDDAVRKIQDTIVICPPVISQYAALGALQAGPAYPRGKLEETRRVRALALARLSELGNLITPPTPAGAFYLFFQVHTARPALELAEALIRAHQVAVIPGETFGQDDGCYLRVSYGPLRESTADEALTRLTRGLRALAG